MGEEPTLDEIGELADVDRDLTSALLAEWEAGGSRRIHVAALAGRGAYDITGYALGPGNPRRKRRR